MEFEGKINNHKSTEQFLQSSNYQKLGSRINNTNEKKHQACLSVFFVCEIFKAELWRFVVFPLCFKCTYCNETTALNPV